MNRFAGEPTLDEVLSDPIIRRVMRADGIDMRRLCEILVKAASVVPSPSHARLPSGRAG